MQLDRTIEILQLNLESDADRKSTTSSSHEYSTVHYLPTMLKGKLSRVRLLTTVLRKPIRDRDVISS